MGLLKLKENETGSMGEYWKVVLMEINWPNKIMNCYLGLYVSKSVADSGKQYMETAHFTYTGEDFDYIANEDIVAKTYSKIKASNEVGGIEQNWFHDAVDIFEEGQP